MSEMKIPEATKYRAGYVGLIGLPNAGKSTLMNALVGQKLGAVTNKPQTTRKRIIGISTAKEGQVLWVDTPGWLEKHLGLNRFLDQEFKKTLQDCDAFAVVLNIDAKTSESLENVLKQVRSTGKPFFVVISKTDLSELFVHRVKLEEILRQEKIPFVHWNRGLKNANDVFEKALEFLPNSPAALYPDDYFTLQSEKDLAQEWILEGCFENLNEEIPYGLAVHVRRFKEGKLRKIYADIVVSKDNYMPIVVGQGGQMLKTIGMHARKQMEKAFGDQVYLELFVKVRKNWMKEPLWMKEYGYELEQSEQPER